MKTLLENTIKEAKRFDKAFVKRHNAVELIFDTQKKICTKLGIERYPVLKDGKTIDRDQLTKTEELIQNYLNEYPKPLERIVIDNCRKIIINQNRTLDKTKYSYNSLEHSGVLEQYLGRNIRKELRNS